jgi:hypothetical protein
MAVKCFILQTPGLTNTSLVQKLVNYGHKKFYNIGPFSRSCNFVFVVCDAPER